MPACLASRHSILSLSPSLPRGARPINFRRRCAASRKSEAPRALTFYTSTRPFSDARPSPLASFTKVSNLLPHLCVHICAAYAPATTRLIFSIFTRERESGFSIDSSSAVAAEATCAVTRMCSGCIDCTLAYIYIYMYKYIRVCVYQQVVKRTGLCRSICMCVGYICMGSFYTRFFSIFQEGRSEREERRRRFPPSSPSAISFTLDLTLYKWSGRALESCCSIVTVIVFI